MTGNNKVWRAPLAGLASVAMIATMGVAAATANADANEAKFVINGNGLTFDDAASDAVTSSKNEKSATYTVVKSAGTESLTVSDLYDALKHLNLDVNQLVTGVYVGSDAYQPSVNKSKNLTVHWADSADEVIRVDFDGTAVSDLGLFNGYPAVSKDNKDTAIIDSNYYLLKTDKLADWQLPQDADPTNETALDRYTADGNDVDPQDTDALFANATVQTDTFFNSVFGTNPNKVTLKAVKYSGQFFGLTFIGQILDEDGKATPTPNFSYTGSGQYNAPSAPWKVPAGRSAYGQYKASLPEVKQDGTEKTTSSWVEYKDGKRVSFTADSVLSENTTVYVDGTTPSTKRTVTFMDVYGNVLSTAKVESGKTVAEPSDHGTVNDETDPADGILEKYAFDGWYNGSDKYDFTKPVYQDLTLQAYFAVSEIGVAYYPGYDNKDPQVVWYKTGDTFSYPSFTRDGYKITEWVNGNNVPTNLKALVGRTVKVEGCYPLNSSGVRNGTLKLQDADASTYSSYNWRKYTAKWTKVSAALLEDLEARVPKDLYINRAAYIAGKDQKVFTADSLDAFTKAYQQYLVDRDKAGYNKAGTNVEDKYQNVSASELSKLYAQLEKAQEGLQFTKTKAVYRLVDPKTGRHLVTNSKREHDFWAANGWNVEGLAFKTFDESLLPSKSDLYTLRNLDKDGDTVLADGLEGLLTSVYRLYNGKTDRQHLTYGQGNEFNALTKGDWHSEGVAFYAATYGQTPVYRMYIKDKDEHFWVTGVNEYNHYQGDANFSLEGVAFRI